MTELEHTKQDRPRKETFVRKGLGKLLILSEPELTQVLKSIRARKKHVVPRFCSTLEFVKQTVGGTRVSDPDILSTVSTLDDESIKYVISKSSHPTIANWSNSLRNLSDLEIMTTILFITLNGFTSDQNLKSELISQFNAPTTQLDGSELSGDANSVWIFYLLFDLYKVFKARAKLLAEAN